MQIERRAAAPGYKTLLVVVLLPLLSLGLASALYFSGWGERLSSRAQGELLPQGLQVELLGLDTQQLEAHWTILILAPDCSEACAGWLQQSAQVHRALGRELPRVQRWLLSDQPVLTPAPTDLPELRRYPLQALPAALQPFASTGQPLVVLADPFGNLVLAYGWENGGRALFKDLKRLLKLSQIG